MSKTPYIKEEAYDKDTSRETYENVDWKLC